MLFQILEALVFFLVSIQRICSQLIAPMDAIWQANSIKKDTLLKNTVNRHFIINVILTELKKLGCDTFHSYDVDVDITNLSVQSPLT